jgi:low affinity Fe/Cu permease
MEHMRSILTHFGVATAHPAAFVVVALYGAAWATLRPATFDFHALATMAVWVMTLVIQRVEHRDTQAIHAKLDELLRANSEAKTELAALDDEEPEKIEKIREERRSGVGQ